MGKLEKFILAQNEHWEDAKEELLAGMKTGHWMWFIFPQLKGLGKSYAANLYGIADLNEANDYLTHPILGARLIEASKILVELHQQDAVQILGSIDAIKLRSSMTLFSAVEQTHPVFGLVLDKFFKGEKDVLTLKLLRNN